MKYIKILLFSLLLLSCNKEKDLNIVTPPLEDNPLEIHVMDELKKRFNPGDVVYLKPDSLKVVLVRYDEKEGWLGVWRDSLYQEYRVFYTEQEIY